MDNYSAAIVSNSISTANSNKAVQSSRALVNGTARNANEAAEQFEAVFISQMLRPMFDTIPENQLLGGGRGEKVWKDMMVEEYGKIIAHKGGLGIADAVKKELIKAQEVSNQ
jgi:Rod binding domain-containing protein